MRRFAVVLLGVVTLAGAARAQSTPETVAAYNTFHAYVEAALAGDVERASSFWRPADLAAAARLGITYPDAGLKLDNDSPLWRLAPRFGADGVTYKFGPVERLAAGPLAGQHALMFRAYEGAERSVKQYLFLPDGRNGWRLASRARFLAEQGPGTAGRYVTVFERRRGRPWSLPPHLLAQLDAAVAGMAARLQIATERLAVLERETLHYLLADPDVVAYLAGAETAGVTDLQVDMVITHHPHHAHELAHLLVNAWLESPPLFTLPLLQEGLATHLGGRRGRAPGVLDRVGRTSLASGAVSLDAMLTHRDFHAQSADLTYAPAGVFAGFLLDAFGPATLRRAYLACSGSLDEVRRWTREDVRRRLSEATGVVWDDLVRRFAAFASTGGDEAVLRPLPGADQPIEPSLRLETGDLVATVDHAPGGLDLRVESAAGPVRAALLIGEPGAETEANPLLEEHLPQRAYHGETHLLLLTRDDARLYDLRRQELVALHSEGFWPSDGPDAYAREGGRSLGLRIAATPWSREAAWTLLALPD